MSRDTDITIPPEALEAGREAVNNARLLNLTSNEIARACFQAMTKAWPGMERQAGTSAFNPLVKRYRLILPLTEKPDGKA